MFAWLLEESTSNPRRIERWNRDERGMLALSSLFLILGFLVLFAFLGNVARAVPRKMETQNTADAVAQSAAVQMARGMNAITAANHLIGELHALTILHQALGGDELDDSSKPRRKIDGQVKELLELGYNVASTLSEPSPDETTYNTVNNDPDVGGAIGDSRDRLQKVLVWSYTTQILGAYIMTLGDILTYVGFGEFGGPIDIYGRAISYAALYFQYKIYVEWQVLKGIEEVAGPLKYVKEALRDGVIPGVQGYTRLIAGTTPFRAQSAAADVGNGMESSLFPGLTQNPSFPLLALPVTADPSNSDDVHSQLVRSCSPWVRYWRLPVLRFGETFLLLARFKAFYVSQTDQWTKELSKREREHGDPVRDLNLYVLNDLDVQKSDKGQEGWTRADGSRRADELFCYVGFAHRAAEPVTVTPWIFRQPNPDGFVTYAQAMIYNANPQTGAVDARSQPVVGWDTLNWGNVVAEYSDDEPQPPDYPTDPLPEPQIRLNWQAKLVPTTRLPDAVGWQTGAIGSTLSRLPLNSTLAGVH